MNDRVRVVVAALGHGLESRCVDAYTATAPAADVRVVDGSDVASCWLRGAVEAGGGFLHLTCELAEPHPGWLEAAAAAAAAGCLPCATLWTPDGRVVGDGALVDWGDADDCVLPFLRRRAWRQLAPVLQQERRGVEAVAGGDPVGLVDAGAAALTAAAAEAGLRPRLRTRYAFTWHGVTVG